MSVAVPVLEPGATIGILGSGQLGRMLALAAARLGFKCHIFAPDRRSPAFDVAHAATIADYSDQQALARFADSVDVFAPGTRSGNTCTGTKLGTIPLNHGDNPKTTNLGSSSNGMWWAKTTASTVCAISNFGASQGGIGALDVKTILTACTNIVPPAAPAPANATPANVSTTVTTKAPATSQKHADDMIQRFERAVPPNPSDLPKSQRTTPSNGSAAQKQ